MSRSALWRAASARSGQSGSMLDEVDCGGRGETISGDVRSRVTPGNSAGMSGKGPIGVESRETDELSGQL